MKAQRQAYEQWENHAFKVLDEYLWLMRDFHERFAQQSAEDEIDRRFVYSQHNLDFAEYIADEFLLADREERILIKDEVEKIERELAKWKN